MQKDAKAKMLSGCVRTTCREAEDWGWQDGARGDERLASMLCLWGGEQRDFRGGPRLSTCRMGTASSRLKLMEQPRSMPSSSAVFFLLSYQKTQDLVGPTAPDSEARWAETLGRSGAQSLEPSVRWDIHPEVTIARGSEWHDTVCRWEGSFPDLERHPRGNQPWL